MAGKRKHLTLNQKRLFKLLKKTPSLLKGQWYRPSSRTIGTVLKISHVTVNKGIQRLVTLGYLRAKRNKAKRTVAISLTTKGMAWTNGKAKTKPAKGQVVRDGIEEYRRGQEEKAELARITELVKPRPWETTYDVVASMVEYIKRKKIIDGSSR